MSVINVNSKYLAPTAGTGKQSAKSCIDYLSNSEPHTADDIVRVRNLMTSTNCGDFMASAERNLKNLDGKDGDKTVALYSIVQSFSKDELDYTDPQALEKAHKIGVETALKTLETKGVARKYAVYTQADGQSHHLHNHILILNYDNAGRAISHGLNWKRTLQPINDEVTKQELGTAKIPDPNNKHVTPKEAKKYIAEAVKKALKTATTLRDFENILAENGVKVRHRNGNDLSQFRDGIGIETNTEPEILRSWQTKSGKFTKSLTFEYQGIKARSARLDGLQMTTHQIFSQIVRNEDTEPELTPTHAKSHEEQQSTETIEPQPAPQLQQPQLASSLHVQQEQEKQAKKQRQTKQRQQQRQVKTEKQAENNKLVQVVKITPFNKEELAEMKSQEAHEIFQRIEQLKKMKMSKKEKTEKLESMKQAMNTLLDEASLIRAEDIQHKTDKALQKQDGLEFN